MNTRSNIQLVIEEENAKSRLKNALLQLIEAYEVKGNVFALDYRRVPVEVSNGYLVVEKSYDNLNDCIKEMKINQAISISEGKFILGNIEQHLADCDEAKQVLDIENLHYIR